MSQNNFCIFGRQPILEAFKSEKRFDKILILKNAGGAEMNEIEKRAKETNCPVQRVPKEKLDGLVRKYSKYREANHQGVIGFLSLIDYHSVDDVIHHTLSNGENPLLLVLDGITDVGNFGAIARSAECLGAHALVIPAQGSAQINPEAMKTSAGALNKIFVCREKSLVTVIKFMKASGLKIFAASAPLSEGDEQGVSKKNIDEVDFSVPCAIVLGAEDEGISKEVLNLCDEKVFIAMSGTTASLNVSVSAGIVLYEAVRNRKH